MGLGRSAKGSIMRHTRPMQRSTHSPYETQYLARKEGIMRAHYGISRRHVLGMGMAAVGSLAMAGGVRSVWGQAAKRIEQLTPELDKIIATSEPIQTLAEGFGGPLGP